MLLRVGPPSDTLDFTRPAMWGHALHSRTFRSMPIEVFDPKDYPIWRRWLEKRRFEKRKLEYAKKLLRRVSFMVHSMEYPRIGMKVRWNGAEGVNEGILIGFEPCGNPKDMHTLIVDLEGVPNGMTYAEARAVYDRQLGVVN